MGSAWVIALSTLLGVGMEALTAALNATDKKSLKELTRIGTEISKLVNKYGISYQDALNRVSDIKYIRSLLGNTSKASDLLLPHQRKAELDYAREKAKYEDATNKLVQNQDLINDLEPNKSLGEHVSEFINNPDKGVDRQTRVMNDMIHGRGDMPNALH